LASSSRQAARRCEDAVDGAVDATPLVEQQPQRPLAVGGQAVEALVALVLLAPFADEQPLCFQPPQQRVQGVLVDVQAKVRQGFSQRVAVVLDAQLGECGHHEAAAAELEPKVFEGLRAVGHGGYGVWRILYDTRYE